MVVTALVAACADPAATPVDGGAQEPGCDLQTWYADRDGDGLGDSQDTIRSCDPVEGYVATATDCDDTSAEILGPVPWYADADGDGDGAPGTAVMSCTAPAGYVATDLDCDDTDSAIQPSAPELCNFVDDDCDGIVDEGAPELSWYLDLDGDGYGKPGTLVMSCTRPAGYAATDDDCDDTDASIHPGALELGCGVDRNCDGTFQQCCGDGYLDRAAGEQCDPPYDGGCVGQCNACACPAPGPWQFTDATAQAGLLAVHAYVLPPPPATFHFVTLREAEDSLRAISMTTVTSISIRSAETWGSRCCGSTRATARLWTGPCRPSCRR